MKELDIFPFIKDFTKEEKDKFISLLKPMSAKKGLNEKYGCLNYHFFL